MNRRNFLKALPVLLSGCAPEWDNHSYGWDYDVETQSGLRVRWSPTIQPGMWASDILMTPEFYELTWQRMLVCSEFNAAPIFIVVMPRSYMDRRYGTGGYYYSNSPLIVVDETAFQLRHEIAHHLVYSNGGGLTHDHALFASGGCVESVPWR